MVSVQPIAEVIAVASHDSVIQYLLQLGLWEIHGEAVNNSSNLGTCDGPSCTKLNDLYFEMQMWQPFQQGCSTRFIIFLEPAGRENYMTKF